ncbi:MAG: glucose dehydrogenase [Crocinitomicaceae bacterium]|nr:glucose dehydrogenase [Crocinitomicaceae bacterium]|tara:strand:- start:15394 stop:16797 length:1404 start_codon:yes stop_codon:yes gene_type:complete
MKNLHSFLTAFALFLCTSSVAQTQWDIEGTLLNEYDLVTGVQIPWDIQWGPDDMLWSTTRLGDVLHIDPETGSYTVVLDLNVFGGDGAEPGLLGMAFHPDWENNQKVFLVYCTGFNWNNASEKLSVFDWNGTNLVNEEVLLTVDAGGIHNGSRLLVLPDNTLLMTTGDTGDGGDSSQDLDHLNGKTLRLNLDGSIPSDNPFGPNSYVYTWGHRNSQGLCLAPDGTIYSSEHGQSNWDEFNIIEAGRNYGWPNVEGPCGGASEMAFCEEYNVMEPLRSWAPCVAVNGMEYYNHPAIPAWNNCVLLSVLGGLSGQYERLSVLHLSDDGTEVESEDQYFSEFNQRIRDIAINPNTGAIYVAFNGPTYPGYGPNIIKEFRPNEYDSVDGISEGHIDLLIYPVPATSIINVEISDKLIGGNYKVIDYHGKTVLSGSLNSSNEVINVSSLSRANYYILLENNGAIITRTFTLQ